MKWIDKENDTLSTLEAICFFIIIPGILCGAFFAIIFFLATLWTVSQRA